MRQGQGRAVLAIGMVVGTGDERPCDLEPAVASTEAGLGARKEGYASGTEQPDEACEDVFPGPVLHPRHARTVSARRRPTGACGCRTETRSSWPVWCMSTEVGCRMRRSIV